MPDSDEKQLRKLRNSLQHLMSDKEAVRRDNARLLKAMKYGLKPRGSVRVKPHKSRNKDRMRHYKVTGAFSRFREQDLPGSGRHVRAGVTKLGVFKRRINNVVDTTVVKTATGDLFESLQNQRTWDQVNPGPPYSSGGPFKSVAFRVPTAQLKGQGIYYSSQFGGLPPRSDWEYNGCFTCGPDWGSDSLATYVNSGLSSFPSLSGYHSRAWDQLKPRVAKAGVAQFIYELRDLPRQLETSANLFNNLWKDVGGGYGSIILSPRSVADNFLNHQFGWVPFISDLMSMYKTYMNSAQIIAQSVRDNGRWMKRSRVLEEQDNIVAIHRTYGSNTEPSDATYPMSQMVSPMVVDGISCNGLTDIHVRDNSRVWAVGSFKYYRPEFDDTLADFSSSFTDVQRLLTIFGARINPTVLWKVTPWSWMIDWFAGVGKFIERADDFVTDGIVSKYLYCMRQSDRTVSKTCSINFSGSGLKTFRWERSLSTKQREVADSPYGFNVPWSTLSLTQWAILAAIGITGVDNGFISRGA